MDGTFSGTNDKNIYIPEIVIEPATLSDVVHTYSKTNRCTSRGVVPICNRQFAIFSGGFEYDFEGEKPQESQALDQDRAAL